MPRYIPGEGAPDAKLVVVGEGPGRLEDEYGRPFVGPSGQIVDNCLEDAGLPRNEVYLTNVVKIRPPNNDLRRLKEYGKSIDDYIPELWSEIEEINPNCILALGATALRVLTGQSKITKYRGSILTNVRSGLPKVVGTIHPANLFHEGSGPKEMRSWKQLAWIKHDFQRAVDESKFRDLRLPERTLRVANSSLDFVRFLDQYEKDLEVAVDIETFKTLPLCIALAFNDYDSMSVPLLNVWSAKNPEGIPLHDTAFIWKTLADFFGDTKIKVIGQNFKFDEGRCEDVKLIIKGLYFDTMLGWSTLYPEFPKKLEFISSLLTKEPYYKDELKEYNPKKDKLSVLCKYNAKDSAVTFECKEKIHAELIEVGMERFFFDFVMPLHNLYYDIERRGILIDRKARTELRKKYMKMCAVEQLELDALIGHEVNVNSPKQVSQLIYHDLKCPQRKDTKEDTLDALIRNAVKDEHRKGIIRAVIRLRKVRKTFSTYVNAKVSKDGRMRTVFNIVGTESGRTSTSKLEPPVSVEPMGLSFHTLTKYGDVGKDIRRMFVTDPGYVLMEWDGAQAEARVTFLLAEDYDALALCDRTDFKRNQHGVKDDIHTLTAMSVTGLPFEAITNQIRQDFGKKPRHAGHYGMTKRALSALAKISEWRADKVLVKFHDDNPKIRGVYHAEIQACLERDDQVLTTPHGRRRQFFERWGEAMFREAYSHIPQAVVTDLTKTAMLAVVKRALWIKLLLEWHDSFFALVPEDRTHEAYLIGKEEMERPIDFSRCSLPRGELIIPCEVSLSRTNWEEMKPYTGEVN